LDSSNSQVYFLSYSDNQSNDWLPWKRISSRYCCRKNQK
jgi:hypothetical protein